jgi:hypothetical protein
MDGKKDEQCDYYMPPFGGKKVKKGWRLHFLRLSRTQTVLKAVISNNQATPIFHNLSDQFPGYVG